MENKILILEAEVKQIVQDNLAHPIEITPSSRLDEIGMDSISFIKTVVAIEDTYGFVFDDSKLLFSEFPTVSSFAEYIHSKIYK